MNNERLAKLCGYEVSGNGIRKAGNSTGVILLPDFYSNTPGAAHWRERAEEAILRRVYEATGSLTSFDALYGSAGFDAQIQTQRGDSINTGDFYTELWRAKLDAIIATLDTLEK